MRGGRSRRRITAARAARDDGDETRKGNTRFEWFLRESVSVSFRSYYRFTREQQKMRDTRFEWFPRESVSVSFKILLPFHLGTTKNECQRGRKPDPRAACSSRLLRNDFHSQGTHQLASQSVLPEVENQNPRYTTRSHPHERLPGLGSQIQGSRVRTAPPERLLWPRDSSIGKPIGSPRGRKSDPRYTVRSHPHERLPVPQERKLKFNFRFQARTG